MSVDAVVKLTEVRASDAEALFRWINDADLVRQHGPYRPVSWAAHQAWLEGLCKDPAKVVFAIRLEQQGPPIGLVQLLNIHPVHRSAELTIRIGDERARGKGYGTAAVREALAIAFRDLNLERVYLHVFAHNQAAVRTYEKAGLITEGRLRKAAFVDGRWCDMLLMARLRDDT